MGDLQQPATLGSDEECVSDANGQNSRTRDEESYTDWSNVMACVRLEIALSPLYIAAVHENMKDILLFREVHGLFKYCNSAKKHVEEVTSLLVMPDNSNLLSGGKDNVMYSWAITEGQSCMNIECVGEVQFDGNIQALAAHPTHRMIAILLRRNTILLRHMETEMSDELNLQIKDSNVTCLSLGEDALVYGTDYGMIYIWHYEEPDNLVTFIKASPTPISLLAVRNDVMVSWGFKQKFVRVWDLVSGKPTTKIDHGSVLLDLVVSPDCDHVIVACENGDLKAYQSETDCFCNFKTPAMPRRLAIDDTYTYSLTQSGKLQTFRYKEAIASRKLNRESTSTTLQTQTVEKPFFSRGRISVRKTSNFSNASSATCHIL